MLVIYHRLLFGCQAFSASHHVKSKPVNDVTLKKKIIEKYSYIDQDDDQRQHRPAPLKQVKQKPKRLDCTRL